MATQAERRAATEQALLDATVEVLVEGGYAAVTTRRVADRAGVAQATQRHYFPARTDLIAAAIRHANHQLAADAAERLRHIGQVDAAGVAAGVDVAWELHRGVAFRAVQELWLAAMHDPALTGLARRIESEIHDTVLDLARALFPDEATHPEADMVLETGLAAIRGLAAVAPLLDERELEVRWARVRDELVRMVTSRLAGSPGTAGTGR